MRSVFTVREFTAKVYEMGDLAFMKKKTLVQWQRILACANWVADYSRHKIALEERKLLRP